MYDDRPTLHEALFGNVERTIEHRNAVAAQMKKCYRCANMGCGCHGGTVGCGAFTPHVYNHNK